MTSARGVTPLLASPLLAAAAATPDENDAVGETPPAARMLELSARAVSAADEELVWFV